MLASKIVTISIVSASFLTIGCALPRPKKTTCTTGCEAVPGEGIKCVFKCDIVWDSIAKANQYANYTDPALSTIETSGGNVPVTNAFGLGVVKTYRSNGTLVQSGSFAWSRNGTKLYIANPTNVSQVITNSYNQSVKLHYEYNNIQVAAQSGSNVFQNKQQYAGENLLTTTDSWYCGQMPPGMPPSAAQEYCGLE